MTTTEAFEALMPEPFGYVPFPGEFYPPDQLDAEVKDDPFTTRVYSAAQMRAMFDAATERAAKQVPMQPVVLATDGVIRFQENRIVSALLENSRQHGYGLNEAARDDYTPEERMQVAQLIGYSVSGYGSLSFVTDESCEEADRHAAAIRARDEGVRG